MLTRVCIMQELKQRDWRKLPFKEVRRFRHFLFSENPRKHGYGIFISREGEYWHIEFRGCVEFPAHVLNGRAVSKASRIEAETNNRRSNESTRRAWSGRSGNASGLWRNWNLHRL